MRYVFFLDGDDFLIGANVLNILAYIYHNNSNILATFGSTVNIKNGLYLPSDYHYKYNRKNTKKYYPHLRTAKAKYVKQIPASYLKDWRNKWFMFCTDIALFTSLIEIIGNRYAFIINNLIIYNKYNSLNNLREGYGKQDAIGKEIRKQYHEYISSMQPLKEIQNIRK